MENLYRIDIYHLTNEERDYETKIRPGLEADQADRGVTTAEGRLSRQMDKEYDERVEPDSLGKMNATELEEASAELEVCRIRTEDVTEAVESLVMRQYQGTRITEVPQVASRLAHYTNRLRRLPQEAMSADERTSITRLLRKMMMAEHHLDAMLTRGADGFAILNTSVLSIRNEPAATDFENNIANSTPNQQQEVQQRSNTQNVPHDLLLDMSTGNINAMPVGHVLMP